MFFFRALGRETYRLRWGFIVAGIALLFVGIVYGVKVFDSLKPGGLNDPNCSSALASEKMLEEFPGSRVSIILLASSPNLTVNQPEYKSAVLSLITAIKRDSSHPTVASYYDSNQSSYVSRDEHETFVLIGIPGAADGAYLRMRGELPTTPLNVHLGGPAVADYEINQEVQQDLPKLGAVSLPMLGILLIVIFRSLVAALLPLIIGAISVLGAFSVTRLLSHSIDISVFAANIISLLGLGLAIDYSLLLVSRFRDELDAGRDVPTATSIAVSTAGQSIFLSGTTVAFSLLGLLAFPEMFLRSMGIGGAIAVFVAITASLTVLPALLSVLGPNVNKLAIPFLFRKTSDEHSAGAWRRIGQFVVRWPALVILVTLGLLVWAGVPFLNARFANPGFESLPLNFQSRIVAEALENDFSNGHKAPIEVLVTMTASPVGPDEVAYLLDYADRLKQVRGITAIHGVTSVGSTVPPQAYPFIFGPHPTAQIGRLKKRFLHGNTTLFLVDYSGRSDDKATQDLVRRIHAVAVPDASQVLVGGDTADLVDRLDSLASHLPAAIVAIFLTTFIVLMAMLSSLVIPLKAILLNALSLSASFGLMTWIFQEGHLEHALRFTSSGSLDPTLPVLIFAIAFGLATDYEVFLVSRIKEEYERSGDNAEAVVIGVEKTGGIITAAGLLLVVVVAAFGMSDILSMKEMGVGLAVAVAVDAAIVRPLLVPAAMQLFGKLNYWMPDLT
jgi:RND superfamily putative drug exporter